MPHINPARELDFSQSIKTKEKNGKVVFEPSVASETPSTYTDEEMVDFSAKFIKGISKKMKSVDAVSLQHVLGYFKESSRMYSPAFGCSRAQWSLARTNQFLNLFTSNSRNYSLDSRVTEGFDIVGDLTEEAIAHAVEELKGWGIINQDFNNYDDLYVDSAITEKGNEYLFEHI